MKYILNFTLPDFYCALSCDGHLVTYLTGNSYRIFTSTSTSDVHKKWEFVLSFLLGATS